MKRKSKIVIIILVEMLLILGVCAGLVYLLDPDATGKNDEELAQVVHGIPIETVQANADALIEKNMETTNGIMTEESESERESAIESAEEASIESAPQAVAESEETTASTAQAVAESEETTASTAQAVAESEETTASTTQAAVDSETETTTASTTRTETEASSEGAAAATEETGTETKESTESSGQEMTQDHKAPVFLYFTSSPQIKVGSGAFDVHKYVGYADDIDRNVDIEVSGSVDVNTVGSYTLKITLTDDAGNKTSKNMEVKIVETVQSTSSGEKKREDFSDFVKNYKTDSTCVGIDVSKWQGDIDFEKVKAAGCEFVYMRFGGYDDGEHYIDKYYKQNLAGAKAAGLKIGIYWHAEEGSSEEIEAGVRYLMDKLNGEKLDFPIAYDWEDYRNFENYGMNLKDLNACFDNFEKEIEKYGYFACLYGSKNAQENIWTNKKKNPIWLANYTSATSYAGEYFMWQHSNTGRIDGINGDVDLDVLYPEKLEAIR